MDAISLGEVANPLEDLARDLTGLGVLVCIDPPLVLISDSLLFCLLGD